MAPPVTYYARPSDCLQDLVTPTLTAGTVDTNFPFANVYDRKAAPPFKTTTTFATLQWVFGVAKTLQAIALIYHKLVGATVQLTNNAGMAAQTITIPPNSEDGHCIDPWKSLLGVASTSATTWTLTITGAATIVAIGEVLLIETLRELNVPDGVGEPEKHAGILDETDYGVRLKYGFGVRQRYVRLPMDLDLERLNLISLQRDARGFLRSFPFILDAAVNDCLFVDLTSEQRIPVRERPNFTRYDLELTEQQKGLAL